MNNVRKEGEYYGLTVGCGQQYRESGDGWTWVNLDADRNVRADIRIQIHLLHNRYRGFFDYIEAKDVLEHVPCSEGNQTQWMDSLRSMAWCLAPGGLLFVQVPDIEATLKQFHDGVIDFHTVNRVLFGESNGPYDRHYQTFTLAQVRTLMEELGFEITRSENIHVCAIVAGTIK